jgi:capsid protein
VDDLREVQAVVEKVNGGLISKTTAAAELGYNYEEELFLMQNETAKMNEENTQE